MQFSLSVVSVEFGLVKEFVVEDDVVVVLFGEDVVSVAADVVDIGKGLV